jgi:hypothetical protein
MNIDEIIGKNFSSVISIRENGKILIQNPYGYADINNELPRRRALNLTHNYP